MFTGEFAHKAYMLFYRCVDNEMMEQILKNHEHVQKLCHDYEQGIKAISQGTSVATDFYSMILDTIKHD